MQRCPIGQRVLPVDGFLAPGARAYSRASRPPDQGRRWPIIASSASPRAVRDHSQVPGPSAVLARPSSSWPSPSSARPATARSPSSSAAASAPPWRRAARPGRPLPAPPLCSASRAPTAPILIRRRRRTQRCRSRRPRGERPDHCCGAGPAGRPSRHAEPRSIPVRSGRGTRPQRGRVAARGGLRGPAAFLPGSGMGPGSRVPASSPGPR